MKALRVFCSIVTVLLTFAAVAMAQDVKTDYDHHANFAQYHTY